MDITIIGALVFVCTSAGVLAGMWLRRILPEDHVGAESKETVKVAIGLVATMTALVLGLVTAAAKRSFDDVDAMVRRTSADLLTMDRVLARYGPDTGEIRATLRMLIEQRLSDIWPESRVQAVKIEARDATVAEVMTTRIRELKPATDEQRWLQSRAVDLAESVLETRWLVASDVGPSVPVPLLVVLVFWLTTTFASFGLYAPRNPTVLAALLLCTLSVAVAIFLVLEMDGPFEGLIKISPAPLEYAYSRVGR